MTANSPPTEWGERLLTVGLAITIATIGLVGLGLLVSVDHSSAGVTGRAPAPAAAVTPRLESPQIDNGYPSVELQKHPRDATIDRRSGDALATIDQRRAASAGDGLEPVATTPEISAIHNAAQCSRLEQEMVELNARRRLQHTSATSNRLVERWHQLRNEAHHIGCSGR